MKRSLSLLTGGIIGGLGYVIIVYLFPDAPVVARGGSYIIGMVAGCIIVAVAIALADAS